MPNCSKNELFPGPIKTSIESVPPLHFHNHDHQICGRKIKPRLSGGRLHFVNPSTHPKCFFSGASSITKSEPTGKPAGPRDLAFDEFRNGEKTVRHELINYRKPAPVKHSCCFQSGVTWCSRCSHRVTHTIRNGERGAKFFAAREALAGCRGAALTRRFCSAADSSAVLQNISCPSVWVVKPPSTNWLLHRVTGSHCYAKNHVTGAGVSVLKLVRISAY